jgi:hypothetical protein
VQGQVLADRAPGIWASSGVPLSQLYEMLKAMNHWILLNERVR